VVSSRFTSSPPSPNMHHQMTSETQNILMNKEVIAVNQDELGVQGHRVWSNAVFNMKIVASTLITTKCVANMKYVARFFFVFLLCFLCALSGVHP